LKANVDVNIIREDRMERPPMHSGLLTDAGELDLDARR
jgi:hypothetical protein